MKSKSLLISALFLIATCSLPSFVSAQAMRLYGMCEAGGANSAGVIFQFNHNDSTYTDEFDFGASNGSNPFGALMQAMDENLYGMTYNGGANSLGALFQYNPASATFTKKFDFDGTANGSNPRGSLIQATDGNLYGMTEAGGANASGVIFQFEPSTSTFNKVYDLGVAGGTGPTIGQNPYGSMIQAQDGNLYGMTYAGGRYNDGVLFKFDPFGLTYSKYDFGATGVSGTTVLIGANPTGSLIQATDGNLYGMTYSGGAADEGVLFQFNPADSAYVDMVDFGAIGGTGPTNGIYPSGSLIQATDGNLYGMTTQGGASGEGVLFKFDPLTSAFTKEVDFAGTSNGASPYGSLMQASDGNLYGITKGGGANGAGVLFQFNPLISAFTKEYDFTSATGQYPWFSNLIELSFTTGMKELLADNTLSLSPNPAIDQLTVRTPSFQNETKTISIMNALGEVLQKEDANWGNETSISIKNLSSGIYFLQLKTEKNTIVEKFIKQ